MYAKVGDLIGLIIVSIILGVVIVLTKDVKEVEKKDEIKKKYDFPDF